MAHQGEVLDQCGVINIDCSEIAIVAVSGDGPNVCGHMLLHTPNRGGYYFHIAGELRGYPRYMRESGYRQYCGEQAKQSFDAGNCLFLALKESYCTWKD